MSNGVVKKTKALGTDWAGSEQRGGERSEPPRSGEPAQSVARSAAGMPVDPQVLDRPVRRRFSAEYKVRIVREAQACTEAGQVGALLRREGLYSSHLNKWRQRLQEGGVAALTETRRGRRPKQTPWAVENEQLRRRNARLERRLKQAETIIEIQKKVSEILGTPLARIDECEGDN